MEVPLDIPAQEPEQITSGDTVAWVRSVSDFQASAGWVLTYRLVKAGASAISLTATADGDAHLVEVAAAATKNWVPGEWRWIASVAKDDERYTVGSGILTVAPDPAGAAFDPRTHEEKCLEAITAVLEGRMGDALLSYKIDGREAEKIPHAELARMRGFYAAKVRAQRGGSFVAQIPVRLTRA